MPRFFADLSQICENHITLFGEDAYHIARSLRCAVGDTLTVTDSEGFDYTCRLSHIRDDACECEIIKRERNEKEPDMDITLFMAYPKSDKLEFVIQKAVELGAICIVPFESSRCIKRPAKEKSERLRERHAKIATEAAKQCGRGRLPKVHTVCDFDSVCGKISSFDLSLFCYEDEQGLNIKEALQKFPRPASVALIVGCEGGFSAEEAEKIKRAGGVSVSLGKRILRCETAPCYALSALSFFFEL